MSTPPAAPLPPGLNPGRVLRWMEPTRRMNKSEAQRQAVALLATVLDEGAQATWSAHVPEKVHRAISRQVAYGVRHAVSSLLLSSSASAFDAYWSTWQRNLPHYWEPPTSDRVSPELPEQQLRALRWTAALVALHVRNALEDLHAQYTSDATMPALNRALRNAVYQALLDHPAIGWELSTVPRFCIDLSAQGIEGHIPAVAG